MKNVRKLLLIVTLCSLFIDVRAEGLSELLNDGVITLERSGTKVTMDMQNHKRVNYASKGKRPWLSLAVENNDRQGRNYWANFSHQAVIGVVPKKMSPEEHAEAEKKMHAQSYDSTKITDWPNGGKLLVYEKKYKGKLVERRVFLWLEGEDTILMLDCAYLGFQSSKRSKKGREFIVDTLNSLRINGEKIPMLEKYIELLGS